MTVKANSFRMIGRVSYELLDTAMVETAIFDRCFRQPRLAPAKGLRPQVGVPTGPTLNVDLAQRFVDAIQSDNRRSLDVLLLDGVELQLAGSTPVSGTFRGRRAVGRHMTAHLRERFTSGTLQWGTTRLVCQDQNGFCRLATIEAKTKRGTLYQQVLGVVGSYHGDAIAALQVYFDTAAEEEQAFDRFFSKCAAVEFASQGIRVNSVHPGFVETDIQFEARAEIGEEYFQSILNQVPLGISGVPRDVANCVLFLASDESSYITGAVLVVDGGLTAV